MLIALCNVIIFFIRINKRSCSMVLDHDDGGLGRLGRVADLLLEAFLPQEETHRLNPGITLFPLGSMSSFRD